MSIVIAISSCEHKVQKWRIVEKARKYYATLRLVPNMTNAFLASNDPELNATLIEPLKTE